MLESVNNKTLIEYFSNKSIPSSMLVPIVLQYFDTDTKAYLISAYVRFLDENEQYLICLKPLILKWLNGKKCEYDLFDEIHSCYEEFDLQNQLPLPVKEVYELIDDLNTNRPETIKSKFLRDLTYVFGSERFEYYKAEWIQSLVPGFVLVTFSDERRFRERLHIVQCWDVEYDDDDDDNCDMSIGYLQCGVPMDTSYYNCLWKMEYSRLSEKRIEF